ncbi:hypothetical protein [Colwellia sp. MB3u-4]|uniref:hypothetical protein n=1 Tax=Colwellia sp. MB3u-4 TaxID=2759822 RepID=UPI0015F5569E|nr:hypothetical protein [Colwellia sp. MB3u-4]MBA6287765.1 hypothetical protein [Colwellia sp. MB3u-4]
MSSTKELETIEKGIEELTYLLENENVNHEATVKELCVLEKIKDSLYILSDDGLYFSPINQFNSVSYGLGSKSNFNSETYGDSLKSNFYTFLVTKYDKKFRDCDGCNKSKDKMEMQVFMPSCMQHLCLNCFDIEMKENYINDNFNFEIIEMHKDISECKYSFSYDCVSFVFDTFTYYQPTKTEDLYYISFYQKSDLGELKEVCSLTRFELSKRELNFLKTQYNLKNRH